MTKRIKVLFCFEIILGILSIIFLEPINWFLVAIGLSVTNILVELVNKRKEKLPFLFVNIVLSSSFYLIDKI